MEMSVMRRGKKFMLTDYLGRGIEVAVITSRLFVSLGDWPRKPSFLLTPKLSLQFASGTYPDTLESNSHAHSLFI